VNDSSKQKFVELLRYTKWKKMEMDYKMSTVGGRDESPMSRESGK
jgi:hypothetical protein